MSSNLEQKKLILVGGGGHCKVVLSQIKKLKEFEIIGIVDNYKPIGSPINGVNIIGTDEDLKKFYEKGIKYALITVGSIKDNFIRYKLYKMVKEIGFILPTIISPSSIIDETVNIDEGTVIMPNCVIDANSCIGVNCIINSSTTIGHDCIISNHCHIAPGVHIAGGVEIDELTFIGIGATIIQGIKIGKNVTIGAGSIISKNIFNNIITVGYPAKNINIKGENEKY